MIKENIRNEAIDILMNHIEQKKMRKTPERFAILDIVLDMEGHHTVEEIRNMMPSNFSVSTPTVYTTMQMLDELNIVQSHRFGTSVVYEVLIGTKPHHHYVCTSCGKIQDLIDPQIDYILGIAKTPRFSKVVSSAYIFGLCNTCKAVINKMKKKEERERLKNMSREEKRFAQINKELANMAKELEMVGISGKK